MLIRILRHSLRNRPKVVLLTLLSITLGATVVTTFLGLSGDISRKMALELRKYGANILVEPAATGLAGGGYLLEEDLPRIKTVFWKYNITGIAPYLYSTAEFSGPMGTAQGVVAGTWFSKRIEVPGEMPTNQGVRVVSPWWQVQGRYPAAADEAVVGGALARRAGVAPGATLSVERGNRTMTVRVAGIVTTGGFEEDQVFLPLETVQEYLGLPGKVSRVMVSALTVPMDEFGRKDPASMNKLEYEKWYCTAYVTSVAKNVEEAMTGSRAKPIWQIADAEGAILKRLNAAMLILTGIALAAASVSVSCSLTASMAERSREIALMKAVGADSRQVATLFLGETALVALCGGVAGYLLGGRLAHDVSRVVFNAPVAPPAWLFPAALGSALVVALLGCIWPLRKALSVTPVRALRG